MNVEPIEKLLNDNANLLLVRKTTESEALFNLNEAFRLLVRELADDLDEIMTRLP